MGNYGTDFESHLAGLQTFDADPCTAERIRVRCLAVLEVQQRREYLKMPLAAWRRYIEPAAVLGIGGLYLAIAFSSSLALFR